MLMLFENSKVLKPQDTRILRQKNNTYVYHVVSKTYIPEKKYYVYDKVCIGKMIDDEYMMPNEKFLLFYPEVELGEQELPMFSNALKIGATSLIKKVLKDLGMDELLNNVYGDNASLIKDLIAYVIINETSVMQHYPDFAWEHLINDNKVKSDNVISQLFKEEMDSYNNQLFLLAWNKMCAEVDSKIYISYDSTNINTNATGVDLAEFGYAKDDDETPQINLSYACKHDDSTPLFYEMYPGSIIDNYQCKYMIDKAKEYGYSNVSFIFDRGYFSKGNIKYLRDNGCGYLMMIKQKSEMVKSILDEVRMSLKLDYTNYVYGYNVRGITKSCKLFKDDKQDTYVHVFYDDTRAVKEVNQLLETIHKLEEELKNRVENNKAVREENLVKYKKYFNVSFCDKGYYKSYRLKEQEIKKTCDQMGYFVLISSEEMTCQEALSLYRDRDGIEKLFRNLKSGMGYSSFNVHTQQSIEAKTHLIFMANIVRNHIFQQTKKLKEKDNKSYTVPALINQLDKIMVIKSQNNSYSRMYGLTAKQKKILDCFSIDNKYLNDEIDCLNKNLVI